MKWLRREAWQYAILLVLLLAIAAVAVHTTITYLQEQVPAATRQPLTLSVWALTLGFMSIAGAFGLWAVQFATQAEGRRRVGRFVDEMAYFSDGLLALDRHGRVTGSNPAAHAMAGREIGTQATLAESFACLLESDLTMLLRESSAAEVQREHAMPGGTRIYRFRSQPSEDHRVIVISDVTAITRQQARTRKIARLQLIGQIANGVAHDVNTILCSIAGHAALLEHLVPNAPDLRASMRAIVRETEQGIMLAGQLLEFGKLGADEASTADIGEHVRMAADALRMDLPEEWVIETAIGEDLLPVPLAGIQIEQIVLNLGLLGAEALRKPGRIEIAAARPSQAPLMRVDAKYGSVLVISVVDPDVTVKPADATLLARQPDDAGAVQSILRSMISEVGGQLEFMTGEQGWPIYRLALPPMVMTPAGEGDEPLPEALRSYMSRWHVLVAKPTRDHANLAERLKEVGARVDRVDNIVSMLARIEGSTDVDVMLLDERLLGDQAEGLLRAILKLCPATGIVLLTAGQNALHGALAAEVMCEPERAPVNRIFRAMIEAKSLGMRRKRE